MNVLYLLIRFKTNIYYICGIFLPLIRLYNSAWNNYIMVVNVQGKLYRYVWTFSLPWQTQPRRLKQNTFSTHVSFPMNALKVKCFLVNNYQFIQFELIIRNKFHIEIIRQRAILDFFQLSWLKTILLLISYNANVIFEVA